jgi:hypothetical protein
VVYYMLFIYEINSTCSMEQFAMCFPTWANEDPDVANRLRLEVSDFMKNNLMVSAVSYYYIFV